MAECNGYSNNVNIDFVKNFRVEITLLAILFIPYFTYAQEKWTRNDSIKLSKMLSDEVQIHVNDDLKKELEQALTGSPIRNQSTNHWNDFILDVKSENKLPKYPKLITPNMYIQYSSLSDGLFNKRVEQIKIRGVRIVSRIETEIPFIAMKRSTNVSIPLSGKLHFNIYGNYTLGEKRNAVLPAASIPYTMGTGFSYNINKNTVLESQTNYQYNVIQKKWEWFWGLKVSVKF